MRVLGLHPATLAATCLLLLGGCGGVAFEHPLSDDETSQVDERLIGFWEPIPASVDAEEPAPGDLWHRLAVGKVAGKPNRMEVVTLEITAGSVKVQRAVLLATRIGDDRYLSLLDLNKVEKGYLVVRYDLPADDRLRFQILDEDVFAKAVDAGELEGQVTGGGRDDDDAALTVHVTSSTAALRAWIEAHADTCVKTKRVTLRRLVERESRGSAEPPEPPEPPQPPEPPAGPDEPSEAPNEEDDAQDDE